MVVRFVIIGGGPAGNTAATHAARLGAEVTMIERDVVGGAAHLWDCIPSKAMIATGGALADARRAQVMGLDHLDAAIDFEALRQRVQAIEERLNASVTSLLQSQGVTILRGTGRLKGPREIVADTADGVVELEADAVLVATGSRPRIPEWAPIDGERVLTTRHAYPPVEIPEHLVVVGSGVTGVEFVHMFSALGSRVTLIVSRQHVLPNKDPEVAAALEQDFLARGITLMKGARATGIERDGDTVTVRCDDGRLVQGSHVVLAIGSIPNSEGVDFDAATIAEHARLVFDTKGRLRGTAFTGESL
ncbi:MAG TPA: FAD-dependent oxidoreductase [Acidimicrobiales bacterium]|nr:FAD-dependent oxidoreductase [Acidimicrobiales bacterium]